MSSVRLTDSEPIELRAMALVGETNPAGYVCHVAVLPRTLRVQNNQNVETLGQRPPVEEHSVKCNVAGWQDITEDQIHAGLAWIELHSPESNLVTYSVSYKAYPAFDASYNDNGEMYDRQFSCVGFVLCLYDEAINRPIELDSNFDNFPSIALSELMEVWPEYASREGVRARAGLHGPGPWKIVMPAYAFHALSEELDKPFLPSSFSDATF